MLQWYSTLFVHPPGASVRSSSLQKSKDLHRQSKIVVLDLLIGWKPNQQAHYMRAICSAYIARPCLKCKMFCLIRTFCFGSAISNLNLSDVTCTIPGRIKRLFSLLKYCQSTTTNKVALKDQIKTTLPLGEKNLLKERLWNLPTEVIAWMKYG